MAPPGPRREVPWRLAGLGVWVAIEIARDPVSRAIANVLWRGLTLGVSLVAFVLAAILGLGVALGAVSGSTPPRQGGAVPRGGRAGRPAPRPASLRRLRRGAPAGRGWNALAVPLGLEPPLTRDVSMLARAVIALAAACSAFLAEIFRAGIQAVDPGQLEAAKSLGLPRWPRFRFVVLPQTTRSAPPPWATTSSRWSRAALVSVLGAGA